MDTRTASLVVIGAILGVGARCSEPEPRDGGYPRDGGHARDSGPQPDAGPIECLIEGGACTPVYEGAMCGPPFTGKPVDTVRRCIDYGRWITIGCHVPPGGGTLASTCYQYEGPSGSGVALMPTGGANLARTAITAAPCPDALRGEVSLYPPCE